MVKFSSVGALPLKSKGTHNEMIANGQKNDWTDWDIKVLGHDGNQVQS